MTFFDSMPRLCVALLLVAVCVYGTDVTCQPGDPGCGEQDRDIGKAYVEPGPWRRLLWTTRKLNADTTLEGEDFAVGRSLLAGGCSDTDYSGKAVVECTNSVRTNPGGYDYRCGKGWMGSYNRLGELKWDAKLMEAAQKHAEDNARMGRLSHTGSDGSRVSTRVGRTGYSYGPVSENIAYGHTSAKDVVLGWMCSSGHRDNIMSCNFHEIGVGVARGQNGRLYFAQVFACPRGERCGCGGGGANPDPIEDSPGGDKTPEEDPYPEDSPKPEDPYGHGGDGYSPKYEDPYDGDYSGYDPSGKPYGGYGGYFHHPAHSKYGEHGDEEEDEGGSHGSYYPHPYSKHGSDSGTGDEGYEGGHGGSPYYRPAGYRSRGHDKGKHETYYYKSDDGRARVKYSSGPGYAYASAHAQSG